MGQYYKIAIDEEVMRVGFGKLASNDVIVRDVVESLQDLKAEKILSGGPILKINGAASLPVAVAIAHEVTHLYGAVAVFDPKLQMYCVAVSHFPAYEVGDLID